MSTLRILHILDHSIPLHSGYTFRTLSILREQRILGWETVHLTTPKQGPGRVAQDEIDGMTFHRTPSADGTGLLQQMHLTAKRILAMVQSTKPHIIHAHSPVLNAMPSLWAARRHRLPFVYEMRASWEDAAVDHGTTTQGSVRYRLSRALESFALRHADEVTTICEGLQNDIFSRGLNAERVTVIPNAVDAAMFQFCDKPDAELRRSLGLDGAVVIGFVGSFYGYEGLHLLLEAARRMLPEIPHLKVLLVGGGPQEAHLKAQALASGLQDHVIFSGRVAHADIHRYYALIDVLAYPRLPSRLTELVTPLKPLEAMAQGNVFVASDVGGHRELVRHGETGFLFPAGDVLALQAVLQSVLAQRESWPRIRQQARRWVEMERTWTHSVSQYRAVYQRALHRHPHTQVIQI